MPPPFADPQKADPVWQAISKAPVGAIETDEEREAFEEGERFLQSGERGLPHEQIQGMIERARAA